MKQERVCKEEAISCPQGGHEGGSVFFTNRQNGATELFVQEKTEQTRPVVVAAPPPPSAQQSETRYEYHSSKRLEVSIEKATALTQ